MRSKFLGAILFVPFLAPAGVWGDAAPTDAASNTTSAAVSAAGDWKKQIIASLTLNQASFNNWAQGGTDMMAWQAGLNARFEQDNKAVNWLNTLKLQYGLTYLATTGTQVSADTIDLETVYAWKTWPQINPFIGLTAQSQFGPGYNYAATPAAEISDFLAPGYFTESAGLKYTPSGVFNTRAGLGVKETVAYGAFEATYIYPTTKVLESEMTQVGLSWVSELNLKLDKTSTFGSKLDLFWPGTSLQDTVVEWDNLLSFTLNKLFSLNAEGDFRYDYNVYPGIQIKQTLGLGFNYSLL